MAARPTQSSGDQIRVVSSDAEPVAASWLTVDERVLLTWVHRPTDGLARGAVVLCDSLIRDLVLTGQRLRALAARLADDGFVVVRFRWSGESDSATIAPRSAEHPLFPPPAEDDQPDTERWRDDLRAVLALAHQLVPDAPVDLVGLRMGALLAAAVADSPAEAHTDTDAHTSASTTIDRLVLWLPPGSGRTWLRGQAALLRLSPHFTTASQHAPRASGDIELPGRRLTPAQRRDWSALTLRPAAPGRRPDNTLVLLGTESVPDKRLDDYVEAGAATVSRQPDAERIVDYGQFFAQRPCAATDEIVRFLAAGRPRRHPVQGWCPTTRAAVERTPAGSVYEELVDVDGLAGVLTLPVGALRRSVLFLPAAGEPREGPGGLWVQLARELAQHGVQSLRLDARGVAEGAPRDLASPQWPYRAQVVEDYERAARHLQQRTGTAPVLVGSCSGAWAATQVAASLSVDDVLAIGMIAWLNHPPRRSPRWWTGLNPALRTDFGNGSPTETWVGRWHTALGRMLPYPVSRLLARLDVVTLPEPLLDSATATGTHLAQLMGDVDLHLFRSRGRGDRAEARLQADGRDLSTDHDPRIDHALFTYGAQSAAREWVLRRLVSGPVAQQQATQESASRRSS